MSTPVIVLAKQRSGTNLLRKALASSSDYFKDLDEVFHEIGPGYFWKFHMNLISQDPQLSYPSKENRLNIFDAFLNKIREFPEKFTLVDIKYNSTHHFNLFWHSPLENPFLFRILAQRDIPVIHLVRTNILETYTSELVANKTQIYVIDSDHHQTSKKSIVVDTNHMLQALNYRSEEIKIFRRWLKTTPSLKLLELSYESLLDSHSNFSEAVATDLKSLLGISENLNIEVATKKVSQPIKNMIKNYDEVVNALQKGGFSYLIPSEDIRV